MTAHVSPDTLKIANPTIYLHCALTGRVISSRRASNFTWADPRKWEWIASSIAAAFDCPEDAVHAVDTEDRLDCIEITGQGIVAYIDEN